MSGLVPLTTTKCLATLKKISCHPTLTTHRELLKIFFYLGHYKPSSRHPKQGIRQFKHQTLDGVMVHNPIWQVLKIETRSNSNSVSAVFCPFKQATLDLPGKTWFLTEGIPETRSILQLISSMYLAFKVLDPDLFQVYKCTAKINPVSMQSFDHYLAQILHKS